MTLSTWLFSAKDTALPESLPDDALFLGESPDTVALCRHGDRPDAKWTRFDVFTSGWNLRARRLGAQKRVVAAGPVPGIDAWEAPSGTKDLSKAATETRHALLWGRRNEGEKMWIELQVPHLMSSGNQLHPDGHGDDLGEEMVRRRLNIVRHVESGEESGGGAILFQRYAGLEYARTDANDTVLEPVGAT